MKHKSSVSKFLTNRWVLNIVALLALFNVIGYMVLGNINAVLYFIVLAVLVRYFSKNMTIVLGVPLIFVNILAMKSNMLEGMENNTKTTPSSSKENTNDTNVKNNSNKPDPKTGQGLPMKPLENAETNSNLATQTTNGEQQGFEAGRRKNRGYDIDYATTIEDAYDELNNILGSEGITRLTGDTQNLMKQQMHLAEAMKGMGPLIKTIEPMVYQLQSMMGQMGDGKDGLGSIANLAAKFASQQAPSNK